MSEPRFLADAMLVRLARWLRALGYDAAADRGATDHELVRAADVGGRILLSRDRHLVEHLRPGRFLLIASDKPLEQLREVIERCALDPPLELFSRCLLCNTGLLHATESDVEDRIPVNGIAPDGPIRRCPGCERVYWNGSHTRRMRAALARELPEWFD